MDPALFLFSAAGLGILWWRHMRRTRRPRVAPFDEALEIAVHVAMHEAKARAQMLEPLHLLYALLQDEEFRRDAEKLGANVDAIERWIFADLDKTLRSASSPRLYSLKAGQVLERTVAVTRNAGRSARPVDLFASLVSMAPSTEAACAAGGVRTVDLLFVLVHGSPESELRVPDGEELGIVLVNDDISTMELVVEILEQDLAFRRADAEALMLRVHRTGSAEAGRFPAAEARERARAATTRARSRGYPLLLRLES